jgi:hypothetical protein
VALVGSANKTPPQSTDAHQIAHRSAKKGTNWRAANAVKSRPAHTLPLDAKEEAAKTDACAEFSTRK